MRQRKYFGLRGIIIGIIGLMGIVQFHWIEFSSNFNMISGNCLDNRFAIYILEHWYRFFQNKVAFLSPQMFFPIKHTLAYSDLFLIHALPFSLLRWFGLNLFSAYQATVLVLNFLTYVACFLCIKNGFNIRTAPSIIGALFFVLNSPKMNRIVHAQLQPIFIPCLAMWLLITVWKRYGRLTSRQLFAYFSAILFLILLQCLTSYYIGWFFVFWLFLFSILCLFIKDARRILMTFVHKMNWYFLGLAIVAIVALLPLAIIYIPTAYDVGVRQYENVANLIPTGWSFLHMGYGNYLWGWLPLKINAISSLTYGWEHTLGMGIFATITLIVMTCWSFLHIRKIKFNTNEERIIGFISLMIISTIIFIMIGIKLFGRYSLWYFVYCYFPGAKGIRAVGRYMVLLALPISICFSFVFDRMFAMLLRISNKLRKIAGFILLSVGAVFLLAEQCGTLGGFSKSGQECYLNTLRNRLPDISKSFYVSARNNIRRNDVELQIDALLISALTGIPTLNGYSGFSPRGWELSAIQKESYKKHVQDWVKAHELKNVYELVIEK